MATGTTLEKLLGEVNVADFASTYLEKKVLHAKASLSSQEIEQLYSLKAIDAVFAHLPLMPHIVQVIAGGTVDSKPAMHPAGGLDAREISSRYANGATLRLNAVHEYNEQVRVLCKDLARDCKCPVFANVYITPPGNPGFNPHYDDHDVMIIQCHGKKEWSFHEHYENKADLPLHGFSFEKERHIAGPATERMVLEPGDVLYVPRGHMHSARAQAQSDSVHITLAINWITWNELFLDLVAQLTLSQRELRRAIVGPQLAFNHANAKDGLANEPMVAKVLRPFAQLADIDGAIDELLGRYVDAYAPVSVPVLLGVSSSSVAKSCDDEVVA